MALAIALVRSHTPWQPAGDEALRTLVVTGCALALIFAKAALPY